MSEFKQRRVARIRPERSDTAFLCFKPNDLPALILDISELGCCLALVGTVHEFELQQNIEIKLSRTGPKHSEIRWMEKIDDSMFKMGVEFSPAEELPLIHPTARK